jgi:hypothetical protein
LSNNFRPFSIQALSKVRMFLRRGDQLNINLMGKNERKNRIEANELQGTNWSYKNKFGFDSVATIQRSLMAL